MPDNQQEHQEPQIPAPEPPMLFTTPAIEGPAVPTLPQLRIEYPIERLDKPGSGSFLFKPQSFELWTTGTTNSSKTYPSTVWSGPGHDLCLLFRTAERREELLTRLRQRKPLAINLTDEVYESYLVATRKSSTLRSPDSLCLLSHRPHQAGDFWMGRDCNARGRFFFYTNWPFPPADPGACDKYVIGNWLFLMSLDFPQFGNVHVIECADRDTARELYEQAPPARNGARKGERIIGVSKWRSYKHPVFPPYQRVNTRSGSMPFQEARDRWIEAFNTAKQRLVREAEVSRLAQRKGFTVQRHYLEDPAEPGYGTYRLLNNTTDRIIGGGGSDYGLTLEDIERFLKEQHDQ
jgi:hypothetical protein